MKCGFDDGYGVPGQPISASQVAVSKPLVYHLAAYRLVYVFQICFDLHLFACTSSVIFTESDVCATGTTFGSIIRLRDEGKYQRQHLPEQNRRWSIPFKEEK